MASILNHESDINKKRIVKFFFHNHCATIPELARDLNLSVPTITKLIAEMVADGRITENGKGDSRIGRKPSTYGLNPSSGYFLGIDIKYNHVNIGLCDFSGDIVSEEYARRTSGKPGSAELLEEVCGMANFFVDSSGIDRAKILNACVNISGRVNPATGYSFSMFNFSETPICEVLSSKLGVPVCIENDTRAMAYGELIQGSAKGVGDALFINLGWGLGMGVIIDGNLYEGKSGFAGELGHLNVFDNEIMCHCGKKGCLETEVSGAALHRMLNEAMRDGKSSVLLAKYNDDPSAISMQDIIEAVNQEDLLCIELLEAVADKLGKQLANMINVFNPELVIIGGSLSEVGEYLIPNISQSIKKYSLRLVSNDSTVTSSKLHEKAGVIGACLTARKQMFEKETV